VRVQRSPAPPQQIEDDSLPAAAACFGGVLATRLSARPGDELTLAELEADMSSVFASGDFSRVDYHLLGESGSPQVLEIHAIEKRGGTNFLRFDLGLAGSSGGDTLFLLRADHRREWVNQLGGQWRNALQLGQQSALETAFYQPLDVPQRFYIEPGLALRRTLEDVFDDGDRLARYALLEAQAQFDVGVNIGNHARVHSGLRWGLAEFDVDIGTETIIERGSTRDAGVVLGALYDTRDADALPTRGTYAQLEFTSAQDWLGGEQSYEVVEGVVGRTMRWGRHVLQLAGGAGRTVGGDLPRHRDFQLGGIRSFPAFARGELRGEEYWSGSATWQLKLADIQALFGQVFFSGFGLQAVRVGKRLDGATKAPFSAPRSLSARAHLSGRCCSAWAPPTTAVCSCISRWGGRSPRARCSIGSTRVCGPRTVPAGNQRGAEMRNTRPCRSSVST
jgi:NTE family protein